MHKYAFRTFCMRAACLILVDGLWGNWGPWSGACSVTCGNGLQSRMRKCDSPAPKFGGKNCTGSDTKTKPCYSGTPCGCKT